MGRVSNSSVVVPFPYSVVLAKVCDILGRRPPYNRFIMMTERSIHVMLLQYLIVKASAYVLMSAKDQKNISAAAPEILSEGCLCSMEQG